MDSPSMDLILNLLIIKKLIIPTATPEQITQNMWKLCNRNISWMRNHEITSDFINMIPNKIPAKVNFKFDHTGLSRADRLTHIAFCDLISKSVFRSTVLKVFVAILLQ